jgi:hypothetical protein
MDLLITIGLDAPLVSALEARISGRLVSYPSIPRAWSIDGRAYVESATVAGRMLEPRGILFYSYFDAPDAAIVRRALALGDTPTFPDVCRTLPLDDKAVGLVLALESGGPRLARGYLPPGPLPAFEGERVFKWGHRHCGEDKVRTGSGFVLPAAALVEPFVEGTSERILIVGDGAWHLRYESDDWRKNVGARVSVAAEPDPALLEHARNIAGHFHLAVAGVDFLVRDRRPYLLEVNAYPELDGLPGAQDAFLDLATQWWERLTSPPP